MSDLPEQTRNEKLAQGLAAAALPSWRKAYLGNLIVSGARFADDVNARGAEYCFAKVEEALKALPPVRYEPKSTDGSSSGAASGESGAVESAPPSVPARPGDIMRRQWRNDRIKLAEDVLDKHAGRLSSLENQSYRDRLAKLRQTGSQPSQAGKADAGLLDLRRRLYQRVLKSQKISLARKRAPEAERFRPPVPVSATAAAWQPVTGPYNDRYNLEELMSLIGGVDPAWVEEFLDLYRGMMGLGALMPMAAKK